MQVLKLLWHPVSDNGGSEQSISGSTLQHLLSGEQTYALSFLSQIRLLGFWHMMYFLLVSHHSEVLLRALFLRSKGTPEEEPQSFHH